MKKMKFHLSTVINFVFFTIFIALLFSSALWFYNSSIKTIQNETNNYFKQNKKITEIILDNNANNLSDLTRQVANKYNFNDSSSKYNQTEEYLEKMFDSNIDHKLDFMFLSYTNGKVIDVSLTIVDIKDIRNNLLNNISEGTIFFKKIKSNGEKIGVLVSKHEIINEDSGRYLGDLYAGIIINDNFSLMNDIYTKLDVESLSFVLDNKIITSSTTYNNKLYSKIEDYVKSTKLNELKIDDNLIIKRNIIKLKDKETSLETITIIKSDTFDNFYDEFLRKIIILLFFVLLLFYISYKMIKRIIEVPLNRLLNFASKSFRNTKVDKFEETRIAEFNNLGLKYEKLISKIKKMNKKLELKVKKRTAELEKYSGQTS